MEKNRLEKVRKHIFYKHMNIVTKNGGKTWEKIFPETHSIRKQTTMEKSRLEKVPKHVFYKHMNILKKNGGKTREKNFSRNKQHSQANNDGKKSSGKSAKTRFL